MTGQKASQPAAASRRRKTAKRLLQVAGAPLIFLFSWYAMGRATSPLRAARAFNAADAPAAGRPAMSRLRIGTYNIAHGRGLAESNWVGRDAETTAKRLRAIARLLSKENLDIVVLNEVDFGCTWTRGVNQAEFIAREAGLPSRAEGRNLDVHLPFLAFRFGNAVLSRFPIVAARAVDYPARSRFEAAVAGQKRGLLCTLDLGDARRVRVLAVHLEHRDEPVRIATAGVIAGLASDGGPPLIAAGDFNSTPTDFPHAARTADGRTALSELLESGRFATGLQGPPAEGDLTFSSDRPRALIDWILVPTVWKIDRQRAIDSQLSDHRPVVAEVELPD